VATGADGYRAGLNSSRVRHSYCLQFECVTGSWEIRNTEGLHWYHAFSADLKITLLTQYIGVKMICVRTKFYMPSSNSSLVIIKSKGKKGIQAATISLFDMVQKKILSINLLS
jgi:hypothetical protein